MERILNYLRETYRPLAIVVYGSFADGSNGDFSDFDALVVTAGGERAHDDAVLDGTPLDVFVWPRAMLDAADPDELLPVKDGVALYDPQDVGAALIARVRAWWEALPLRTEEERREDVAWCEKMLHRAQRGDAEGLYRRHLLLTESLTVWCGVSGLRFEGPKKSLRCLHELDPAGFACYERALLDRSDEALRDWVEHLRRRLR